jgi:hypothetical protein
MRARLPMRIVHNFRRGTSDATLLSCGTDRVHGRRRSRGLGGVPGRIRGLLLGRGVGVGWLAPALQRIRAVARSPFVIRGNESSFDLRAHSHTDAGPPLRGASFPHRWRIGSIGRVVARPQRGFCTHDWRCGTRGSTQRERGFGAASMPLTRRPKNPLRRGAGAGIARSLCSRARLADWPRTSRCFGCSSQRRCPCSCHRDTTGSGLVLLRWGPPDERWRRLLSLRSRPWFLCSILLLLFRQVIAFTSSCLHTLAPRPPRRSHLARLLWLDFRSRALGLSPCLCLWVQASPIFADQVVVAFWVACSTT